MAKPGLRLLRTRRSGIDAVAADTALVFGRHVHEQFGVGLIDRGAQRSASGRGPVEAGAGDLITVNPGEVHDGAPIGDGGRAWRMLYLDPAAVTGLVADLPGVWTASGAEFHRPALSDPGLAGLFRRAFAVTTDSAADADGLGAEAALLLLMGRLLAPRPSRAAAVPPGIALARTLMDDDPAAPLTLAALAREAGLGRYQFLRAFARATGLTPHAYLVQRRLHLARRLIAGGMALAEAAAASGFADQSHLTRSFARSFGTTPGARAH